MRSQVVFAPAAGAATPTSPLLYDIATLLVLPPDVAGELAALSQVMRMEYGIAAAGDAAVAACNSNAAWRDHYAPLVSDLAYVMERAELAEAVTMAANGLSPAADAATAAAAAVAAADGPSAVLRVVQQLLSYLHANNMPATARFVVEAAQVALQLHVGSGGAPPLAAAIGGGSGAPSHAALQHHNPAAGAQPQLQESAAAPGFQRSSWSTWAANVSGEHAEVVSHNTAAAATGEAAAATAGGAALRLPPPLPSPFASSPAQRGAAGGRVDSSRADSWASQGFAANLEPGASDYSTASEGDHIPLPPSGGSRDAGAWRSASGGSVGAGVASGTADSLAAPSGGAGMQLPAGWPAAVAAGRRSPSAGGFGSSVPTPTAEDAAAVAAARSSGSGGAAARAALFSPFAAAAVGHAGGGWDEEEEEEAGTPTAGDAGSEQAGDSGVRAAAPAAAGAGLKLPPQLASPFAAAMTPFGFDEEEEENEEQEEGEGTQEGREAVSGDGQQRAGKARDSKEGGLEDSPVQAVTASATSGMSGAVSGISSNASASTARQPSLARAMSRVVQGAMARAPSAKRPMGLPAGGGGSAVPPVRQPSIRLPRGLPSPFAAAMVPVAFGEGEEEEEQQQQSQRGGADGGAAGVQAARRSSAAAPLKLPKGLPSPFAAAMAVPFGEEEEKAEGEEEGQDDTVAAEAAGRNESGAVGTGEMEAQPTAVNAKAEIELKLPRSLPSPFADAMAKPFGEEEQQDEQQDVSAAPRAGDDSGATSELLGGAAGVGAAGAPLKLPRGLPSPFAAAMAAPFGSGDEGSADDCEDAATLPAIGAGSASSCKVGTAAAASAAGAIAAAPAGPLSAGPYSALASDASRTNAAADSQPSGRNVSPATASSRPVARPALASPFAAAMLPYGFDEEQRESSEQQPRHDSAANLTHTPSGTPPPTASLHGTSSSNSCSSSSPFLTPAASSLAAAPSLRRRVVIAPSPPSGNPSAGRRSSGGIHAVPPASTRARADAGAGGSGERWSTTGAPDAGASPASGSARAQLPSLMQVNRHSTRDLGPRTPARRSDSLPPQASYGAYSCLHSASDADVYCWAGGSGSGSGDSGTNATTTATSSSLGVAASSGSDGGGYPTLEPVRRRHTTSQKQVHHHHRADGSGSLGSWLTSRESSQALPHPQQHHHSHRLHRHHHHRASFGGTAAPTWASAAAASPPSSFDATATITTTTASSASPSSLRSSGSSASAPALGLLGPFTLPTVTEDCSIGSISSSNTGAPPSIASTDLPPAVDRAAGASHLPLRPPSLGRVSGTCAISEGGSSCSYYDARPSRAASACLPTFAVPPGSPADRASRRSMDSLRSGAVGARAAGGVLDTAVENGGGASSLLAGSAGGNGARGLVGAFQKAVAAVAAAVRGHWDAGVAGQPAGQEEGHLGSSQPQAEADLQKRQQQKGGVHESLAAKGRCTSGCEEVASKKAAALSDIGEADCGAAELLVAAVRKSCDSGGSDWEGDDSCPKRPLSPCERDHLLALQAAAEDGDEAHSHSPAAANAASRCLVIPTPVRPTGWRIMAGIWDSCIGYSSRSTAPYGTGTDEEVQYGRYHARQALALDGWTLAYIMIKAVVCLGPALQYDGGTAVSRAQGFQELLVGPRVRRPARPPRACARVCVPSLFRVCMGARQSVVLTCRPVA